jgi:Ser/Thr protein kinase RdoA (MazF antagonist)
MGDRELRRIAEGREAEVFDWDGGMVLRLIISPEAVGAVDSEAAALGAALAAGVNVPAPRGSVSVDGRPGLLMERVNGPDLLTLIARQPWKLWSVGSVTGRLQSELHDVVAPLSLPSLRGRYQRCIDSDSVPAEFAGYAQEVLADLPDGDRLCHGDLHPGNILMADGRYFIIDWSGAARGDPAADYARSQLLLRLAAPPPGAPFLIRTLAGVAGGMLLRAYRHGYRGHRAVDEERVRRWQVPVMADRLVDGIEEERPKLLELLEERLQERS